VRVQPAKEIGYRDLRRSLDRLDAIPLRPSTARQVHAALLEGEENDAPPPIAADRLAASTELDPAWALSRSKTGAGSSDLPSFLEGHRWWLRRSAGDGAAEALDRLWRHSVAVAFAARRLAREAGDPDPDAVGRAGLLHRLGLWAVASVDPDRLAAWIEASDPVSRRNLEALWLGMSSTSLGRQIATRWGCDPLIIDSAWLHADGEADLAACAFEADRLRFIQQGHALAERTPWAFGTEPGRDSAPIEPRVRILMAEVQSRCSGPFIEADASTREERLTRDNARLRRAIGRLDAEKGSLERFARVVAGSSPAEPPEVWADRAALAWCGEPGVAAARVVWSGPERSDPIEVDARPPSRIIALGDSAQPSARVYLWEAEGSIAPLVEDSTTRAAWDSWAMAQAERVRARRMLDEVVEAHRRRVGREESGRRRALLEAMAEFAAGAGHELNNPLAVIVGRAQLLLPRHDDPESTRSLRAIIAQAQRAHRILRDLMYFARPPEARPRPCQPEEVVRACLRDLQPEAEARGVRIVAEARDPGLKIWADADSLRQVADVLVRNALEATAAGGLVEFVCSGDAKALRWTVRDTGRGIGPGDAVHLFDPFYCGRQAGRGLGLGLPRVARIVDQMGGELRWHSIPGQGASFQVTIPVEPIPAAGEDGRLVETRLDRASPAR